jgi:hypothetical protein
MLDEGKMIRRGSAWHMHGLATMHVASTRTHSCSPATRRNPLRSLPVVPSSANPRKDDPAPPPAPIWREARQNRLLEAGDETLHPSIHRDHVIYQGTNPKD